MQVVIALKISNMKTLEWHATFKSKYFKIKEDPGVGFYLYVYEKEKCIGDYLQDSLEIAIEYAMQDYGVPKNAWKACTS